MSLDYLANTLYDDYLGLRGQVLYTATPEIEYPDSTQNVVFGTVYAPRVYGRDLTSFEVASSGSVAVTLNDVHSLDIIRDDTTSNISLVTLCNDSLTFGIQNENVFIKLDADGSNLNMYASSNIDLTAGNTISLNTAFMEINLSNDFTVKTGNDIILDAQSNVDITAQSGYTGISAKDSNVTIQIGVNDYDLELFAMRDVITTASNDISVNAVRQIVTVTPAMSNVVDTVDSTVTTESKLTVGSGALTSVVDVTPGVVSTVTTSNNVVKVDDGIAIAEIAMIPGTMTTSITSNNTIKVDDGIATTEIVMIPGTMTTSITSNNTILVDDGNKSSEIVMIPGTLTVTATDHALMTVQGAALDFQGGDVTLSSSNNIIMETLGQSLKMYTDAYGSQTVSDTKMLSVTTSDKVSVFSSNVTKLESTNKTEIVSNDSSVVLSAKDSNVQFQLGLDGTKAKLISSDEVILRAGADTTVSSINGSVAHSIVMDTTLDKIITSTTGIHEFVVDDAKLMTIDNSNVHIHGNLVVSGVIDTQNITETNLQVQDKTMTLAFNSNNDAFGTLEDDGVTNDQAGIIVSGKPASVTDLSAASNFEKSVRWNYNVDGLMGLGTSNIDNESYWEVKGGSLRLTHTKTKADGSFDSTVTFGFRINHLDEMELVKKFYNPSTSNYVFKRVAKFGTMLSTL